MSSSNDSANQDGRYRIFSGRLSSGKFHGKSLTPSEYVTRYDQTSEVRGRWGNRFEFLLSCIGFAVGLGNVWRFPIRVYESGGGAFLIPYLILCIILGIPLLLLELGFCQFSGLGPAKAFRIVPLFYGIGWCMVIVSVLIQIYYAAVISWSYFYLFSSFKIPLPWSHCLNYFNSKNCLGSLDKGNSSTEYVSSTAEYWDYYVTGFVKYPSREIYTMNEYPGPPQWHLALCLLVTWAVCALSLMFGVKVSGKLMYFLVFYPYLALFALVCLGCTLPGARNGIKFYIYPDWNKIYQPKVLRGVVEQLFFSTSIAMGGMLTYASYNGFNDNFYRDAIIIIFIDFFTSILAGFAVFPILGYLSHRTGVKIEKVITSGSSLFFITITDALATLPGPQFWTILLMAMTISLGMDSLFALIETVSTAIIDAFPPLQNSHFRKGILVWVLSSISFLIGLLLVSPGGKYWFEILDSRVSSFGLPLIALLESLCVGQIYGIKKLRYDFEMMLGYPLSWFWFIMMGFVSPVVILSILVASFITIDRIVVNSKPIPLWGEVIALLFLVAMVFPLFFGIFHTIVTYYKKYPELKGKMFIKKLFSPPIYWGPFYKINWLSKSVYRDKLLKYKDNPRFIKYISKAEDLQTILGLAAPNTGV